MTSLMNIPKREIRGINININIILKNHILIKYQYKYQPGINSLVDRWQRCVAIQDSYFVYAFLSLLFHE